MEDRHPVTMGGGVFKVYVIHQLGKRSEVLPDSKTTTPSLDAALAGWRHMYDQPLDSSHLMLLTRDSIKLAVHRFGSSPGDPDHAPRELQLSE